MLIIPNIFRLCDSCTVTKAELSSSSASSRTSKTVPEVADPDDPKWYVRGVLVDVLSSYIIDPSESESNSNADVSDTDLSPTVDTVGADEAK